MLLNWEETDELWDRRSPSGEGSWRHCRETVAKNRRRREFPWVVLQRGQPVPASSVDLDCRGQWRWPGQTSPSLRGETKTSIPSSKTISTINMALNETQFTWGRPKTINRWICINCDINIYVAPLQKTEIFALDLVTQDHSGTESLLRIENKIQFRLKR